MILRRKKQKPRKPFLACLAMALLAGAPRAQAPGQQPIRVGVNVVRVPVWVVDPQGQPVNDLQLKDFRILENGKEQKVAHMERGVDPVHVALVVDTSNSTAPFLASLVEAARQFSQRFGAEDRLAVYEAGPQVVRMQGFTNSREALLAALRDLRTAEGVNSRSDRHEKGRAVLKQNTGRGGTLLFDAMMLVRREFPEEATRRVILLFTDGWDSGSDALFKNVRNAILLGNEQVFTVLAQSKQDAQQAVPHGALAPPAPQPRPPQTWALVLDTLAASEDTFPQYQRVAQAFLGELDEADGVWLFSFNQRLTPTFPPGTQPNSDGWQATLSPAEALAALRQIRRPSGAQQGAPVVKGPALPDHILFLTEEGSRGPREFVDKALPAQGTYVVLSVEEFANENETQVAMQTLIRDGEGIRKVRQHVANKEHEALQTRLPQLTVDSGGALFPMQNSKQLEGIYQQIADQIRASYTLGYYTDAPAGRQQIDVLVPGRDARVHARRALVVQ